MPERIEYPVSRLDGEWMLAIDPENQGREQEWFREARADAQPAPVPGIVQQIFPTFHGVAWYWRRFEARRTPSREERAILRFGAVDYLAEVWLNAEPVGGHEGSEPPFELDVTGALKRGENLLAVRVLKPGSKERIDGFILDEIPHRNQYDHATYRPGMGYNTSGIILPVELHVLPATRVVDVFVLPDVRTGEIKVQVTIANDTGRRSRTTLEGVVSAEREGHRLDRVTADVPCPRGTSTHSLSLAVSEPRLWALDDPALYRVTVSLAAGGRGTRLAHEQSVRCGFRDFRVIDGFFHLNGKRLFLKSSHTGNHFPIGHVVPPDPDLMRRDLFMAKASGFNCIRFISGMPYPEQLDCCDEIGLMVYEENLASWLLGDSPKMPERYDLSCREMVLRDRNHPSVVIWGMINEMRDGPTFRQAVKCLGLVRSLDPSRLVLLASGRWDAQPTIGSVSNPGSNEWEPVWGVEGPDAPAIDDRLSWRPGGYIHRAGDAHIYPLLPMGREDAHLLRTTGADSKPVFLSEFGVGSQFNAIDELRGYGPFNPRPDLVEVAMIRGWVERLTADLKRFGLEEVFPFPNDFFRESYRHHSRQRRLAFDLVRSNPQLCGYNLTGLLDHAVTGEGLWSFWRRWKPEIVEALEDGWSPLKWCLFVDPMHGYAGRPVLVEAVLANEDVLAPGEYPVCFRVWGEQGIVWQRRTKVRIPEKSGQSQLPPLAVPVLKTRVKLDMPEGDYMFAADLERGGAPTGDRLPFRLTDPSSGRIRKGRVVAWGLGKPVQRWLEGLGLACVPLDPAGPRPKCPVLVGEVTANARSQLTWDAVKRWLDAGTTILLLSPKPLRGEADASQLPWGEAIRARAFHDWLYHKDLVSRRHPVFEGLQSGSVFDWSHWGHVLGHDLFDCDQAPDEVIAAAFAVGYSCPGGYDSGVILGSQTMGKGRLIFNALQVLPHINQHPAADRLLLNLIDYARRV